MPYVRLLDLVSQQARSFYFDQFHPKQSTTLSARRGQALTSVPRSSTVALCQSNYSQSQNPPGRSVGISRLVRTRFQSSNCSRTSTICSRRSTQANSNWSSIRRKNYSSNWKCFACAKLLQRPQLQSFKQKAGNADKANKVELPVIFKLRRELSIGHTFCARYVGYK